MASKKPTPKAAPESREELVSKGVLWAMQNRIGPDLDLAGLRLDANVEMAALGVVDAPPTHNEILIALGPLLASGRVIKTTSKGIATYGLAARAPKGKKAKQAPIPKKVIDTTEKDKRETLRTKILDAVDAAPKGRISISNLGLATGTPVNGDDHQWDRMLGVLRVLESSGVLVSKIVKMTTVISRGNRDTKPAKVPFVLTPELKKALHKAMLKEIAAWKCWHRCDVVAGAASNALPDSWSRDEVQETYMEEINELVEKGKIQEHDHWYAPLGLSTTAPNGPNSPSSKPAKKAKGALTPEARAELAQSADEALSSPEVAGQVKEAAAAAAVAVEASKKAILATTSKGTATRPEPAPAAPAAAPASDVHTLPLSLLRPSPSNPRRRVGDLEALAASLKSTGQVSPILVRPHPTETGLFEVVCGHRRSAAAQLAGLGTVLVVIRELSDREVLEAQIAENSQRVDVHPLEEADAFNELHKKHGVAVEEIAARLGRPVPFVHARLRLLKLASGPRAALELGRITLGVALELTRLPEESQEEALPRILVGQGAAPKPLADCKPVLDKLSLRLIDAPFALDDASLPGGACTRCPKRTGAQAALFAEADGPDLCTDRRCYQDKVAVSEGRALRTTPRSREIAQDPAPIAPPSSVIQPDRPAIENGTAPIAQDRAAISPATARAEQYAKEEQLRREIEARRERHSALYKRLVGCPFDEEVFRAIALPMLSNRIGEIARSLDDLGLLVMIDEERGFANLAATGDRLRAAPVSALWALLMGFLAQSMSYGPQPLVSLDDIERRLDILDRATTPAPASAAQVDEDDGPPALGLSTEEAVAKVLLEHGPQTSRQVASALGWDEEDRETQHKATAALAKVATCIDTRWYLPEQIPVRARVLAALKATKVRRNARVLATTMGLVESEVATVLKQLEAERVVMSFSGGTGAGSAYQLRDVWQAGRGKPKGRGKGREGKKGKAPAPAVVDWRQLRQRVTSVLAKAQGEALTLDQVVAQVAPFTKEEVFYTLSLFDQASAVCFAQDLVTTSSAFDDDKISESIWRTVYDYVLELVGEQKEPPTGAHLAGLIMLPEAMVSGLLGELVEAGRLTTVQVEAEPPTYLVPAAKPAKPAKKGRRHSELKTAILEQVASAEEGRELLSAIVRKQAWLGTEAQVTLAVDELVAADELSSKPALTGGRWITQAGAGKAAAE